MSFEALTDENIAELIKMEKEVQNPGARKRQKRGHEELEYELRGNDGETRFLVYLRQNRKEADDFSCGLRVQLRSGEQMTLTRYNGPSHPHKNPIEETRVDFVTHIHRATERYMNSKEPEKFAEETNRYASLNQAFRCLVEDCNVTGITIEDDRQEDLFPI